MKRVFALLVLLTFVPPCFGALPANEVWREDLLDDVVGYGKDTTGGAGGTLCEVTSLSNSGAGTLRECATQTSAQWIVFRVSGTITLTSVIEVANNKTIDGRGANIVIAQNGLILGDWLTNNDYGQNVIVHNIKFIGNTGNAQIIISRDAYNVWIDHCTFQDAVDEELYVGSPSNSGNAPHSITISWNNFDYTTDGVTYANKAFLMSDPSTPVDAAITLTMHHNWFDRTDVRTPFMRHGQVHSFNNYYDSCEICVQVSIDGDFRSENDTYDVPYANPYPWIKHITTEGGNADSISVTGEHETGTNPVIEEYNAGGIFTPPYSYTLETADAALRTTITAGAGWYEDVTLHDLTATSTGTTRANVSFNVANRTGTVYGCVTTSSTPPSVADHKAGTGCTKWFRDTPEARINRMLQTRTLDNASWVKRGTTVVTANSITAPDGTATAEKVEGINANGVNDLYSLINGEYTASTAMEASFWIKRISTSGSLAVCNNNCSNGRMYIDLSALSDNWEFITDTHPAVSSQIAFVAAGAGNDGLNFHRNTGGSPPFSFYLWEPKLEAGTFPTYQPITTTTAAVTRAARTTIDPFVDGLSLATAYYVHAMQTSSTPTDSAQYTEGPFGHIAQSFSRLCEPCANGTRQCQFPLGGASCTTTPPEPGADWTEDFSTFSPGVVDRADLETDGQIDAAGFCWEQSGGDAYDSGTIVADATYAGGKLLVMKANMNDPNNPECSGIDWTGTAAHNSKHRTEIRVAANTAYETHPHGVCRWVGFVFQPRLPNALNEGNILTMQSVTEDAYGPEAHLMWLNNKLRTKIKLSPIATDVAVRDLVTMTDQNYYEIVMRLKRDIGSGGIWDVWVNASDVTDAKAYGYTGRTARCNDAGDNHASCETDGSQIPLLGLQLYNGTLLSSTREAGLGEVRIWEGCDDGGFYIVKPRLAGSSPPTEADPDWAEDWSAYSLGALHKGTIETTSDILVDGGCYSTLAGVVSAGHATSTHSYDNWTVVSDSDFESGKAMELYYDGGDLMDKCTDYTGAGGKARAQLKLANNTAFEYIDHGECRWMGFSVKTMSPDSLNLASRQLSVNGLEDGSGQELGIMWYQNKLRTTLLLSGDAPDAISPAQIVHTLTDNTISRVVVENKRSVGTDGRVRIWVNRTAVTDTPALEYNGRTAKNESRIPPDPRWTLGLYDGTTVDSVWQVRIGDIKLWSGCNDAGFDIVAPVAP